MRMWNIFFSWLICGHAGSEAILVKSEPSYVSEWTSMTSNSNTSHVSLKHDFHEIPVYVRVDGRTTAGFIFPAFGSAQQDDDTRMTYGGIVFFYNETHIDILVSAKNNVGSEKQWAAIYTGMTSTWAGPKNLPRIYQSITVQAKAWKSGDLPPPAWESQKIHVAKGDCVDTTLQHSLTAHPDWIIVQIRDSRRVFQGQGMSSVGSAIASHHHFGGILFGSNESHVRLWSACNTAGNLSGVGLFNAADGWGGTGRLNSKSGNISAYAWDLQEYQTSYLSQDLSVVQVEGEGYLQNIAENLTTYTHTNVKIEVLEGTNKNFRFDGIGSVMNEWTPFGGLVYGYNDSTVAIWIPHPDKRDGITAAVFMIGNSWGWGFKTQMTNNIKIIITVRNVMVPMCGIEVDVIATYEISFLNSYINNNWLFKVGAEITMSCKSGYHTSEENVKLVCKAENNGSWSRNPPQCEEIQCPNPLVNNTNIVSVNRSLGGIANISCAVGYRQISGDMLRVCHENGTWSGFPPVCKGCYYPCLVVGSVPIKTKETEELKRRINELKTMLSIQKNSTTKAKLKKICVYDPRPSAKGLGAVLGAGIIVAMIIALIISDLPIFISLVNRLKKEIIK